MKILSQSYPLTGWSFLTWQSDWASDAMQKCNEASHMFPTDNMTEEVRACSPSSHVEITSSGSCGWVGGDGEIRETLDLLDFSAASSAEWFFFYLPWFLFPSLFFFCWCACRNVVRLQVTVLVGLTWHSVPHWSNFRTHHFPLLSNTRRGFILYRIHVK